MANLDYKIIKDQRYKDYFVDKSKNNNKGTYFI